MRFTVPIIFVYGLCPTFVHLVSVQLSNGISQENLTNCINWPKFPPHKALKISEIGLYNRSDFC